MNIILTFCSHQVPKQDKLMCMHACKSEKGEDNTKGRHTIFNFMRISKDLSIKGRGEVIVSEDQILDEEDSQELRLVN